jgi:signal transduction histidine kinase
MFFFSYYFLYTFVTENDLPLWQKIVGSVIILPTAISTFLGLNLRLWDANNCVAIENTKITGYLFFAQAIFIIASIVFSVVKWIGYKNDRQKRKETVLVGMGVILFLIFFFSALLLVSLFAGSDASSYVYNYEIYGLFGIPILLIFLGYLIVKFKSFDIKLLATQALVWALIIVIGSQYFFIEGTVNMILVGVTLVLSAISGYLIVRSVKKEVALRESLEVANKGQENLIHVMNHQIKGFFGTARNIFAELLQSDDYGHMPKESEPLLAKGLESTKAGVDYVQDILKGFNAGKGFLQYDMKLTDIKPMVLDLLSEQKDIATKSGLSFESNIGGGDYNVVGDAVQLKEAFKNLITNAIKYNDYKDPNRGIKVNLANKDNKIVFSVRDTGVGILEEDKPRIFTAGGMGKDSTKYNAESSGFGLVFVKGVVDAHKGIVGYKSNEPEKGTTFYIELPLAKK